MRRLLIVVPALCLALSLIVPGQASAAGNSQNPCIGSLASGNAGPGYGQFVKGNAQQGIVGPFASWFATSCNPSP